MSGAMSVLPAPVSGVLAPPLDPPLVVSLLEPHAATPSASTPQHATASIDLREITWLSLLDRLSAAAFQRAAEYLLPGGGRPVNKL
jgi:hypothetical protein